jgi:multidrug efflux system outer membrane protein
MRRLQLVLLALSLLVAGCKAGPNYKRADPPVPAQFGSLEPGISTSDPIGSEQMKTWWKIFRDPVLDSLIERAVEGNLDLRIAEARVRQARAQGGVASSKYYPEGEVRGSYGRFKSTESGFTSGSTTGGGAEGARDREFGLYLVGFDASWEVDVFGGVRREVEAANADLAASREALRDTLVTLQGEVARNYVEARALQLRLEIAREDVRARRENVELNEAKFRGGLIPELDLARARGALANAKSTIPPLENAMLAAMHRLAVLLGQEPISLIRELSVKTDLPQVPENLPAGLPSDLLRRRPDIRRAERELAAATARIGVSTADLFPRFSLTGSFGYQSLHVGDLFDQGSNFWRIGPTIGWNILNLKRILSNIEVSEAVRDGSLAQYEKSVLTALEEVENALVSLSREKRRAGVLTDAVRANGLAADLALARFQAGLESYLAVIDAQSALRISQDQLAQSKQNTALGLIALYKALGGGWQEKGAKPQ